MFGVELKLDGRDRLIKRFRAMAEKVGREVRLVVGYSAPYAMRIHEDLEMPHKNGQAKFLEEPLKLLRNDMRIYIRDQLRKEVKLEKVLINVGNKILSVSRKLVPVDTGRLRDSGYVVVETARGFESTALQDTTTQPGQQPGQQQQK